MIPLNHKVEIEFGELMELVDKAKKLEALESRSCEGCKYSEEEMELEDARYLCSQIDFSNYAPFNFRCNKWEAKQ